MKFQAFFTGFVVALPCLLAAALPAVNVADELSPKDIGIVDPSPLATRDSGAVQARQWSAIHDLNSQIVNNEKRGDWTQRIVREAYEGDSSLNWVICHVASKRDFQGQQGSVPVKYGSTKFTLYGFETGWFNRTEDGGYDNWAYEPRSAVEKADGGASVFFF